MRDYDNEAETRNYYYDENPIKINDEKYKVLMSFLSGIISLGLVLVLGSYGYTWSEEKSSREENREWRKDHQGTLDHRFDKLEQGQDKLENSLNKKIDETKDMLQRILDEQLRVGNALKTDGVHNRR